MSLPQVVIVSSLYVFLTIFIVWACVTQANRAVAFEDIAYAMSAGTVGELESRGDVAAALITAFGLAISASLKFMWDIRHPEE